MTSLDPRLRVCGVCATVLDYIKPNDPNTEPSFQHNAAAVLLSEADDHPPVPVLPGEVYAATFCDLCFAPDPVYLLPADDFVFPDGVNGSIGAWQICGHCARLVDLGRWNEIARKVVAGMFTRHGHEMSEPEIAFVKRTHRLLQQHITGSPKPSRYPSPADGSGR